MWISTQMRTGHGAMTSAAELRHAAEYQPSVLGSWQKRKQSAVAACAADSKAVRNIFSVHHLPSLQLMYDCTSSKVAQTPETD